MKQEACDLTNTRRKNVGCSFLFLVSDIHSHVHPDFPLFENHRDQEDVYPNNEPNEERDRTHEERWTIRSSGWEDITEGQATDRNNDDVSYFIDWGDNTTSGWVGPYASGVAIIQSHAWSKKGTYTIKAKARDVYGTESGWGTFAVSMPSSFVFPHVWFFTWLFERFPHAFPLLHHFRWA